MFLVYVVFCFIVVWLSVPVQLIAWKDSSPKMTCYVSSGTLNPTHSLTYVSDERRVWPQKVRTQHFVYSEVISFSSCHIKYAGEQMSGITAAPQATKPNTIDMKFVS